MLAKYTRRNKKLFVPQELRARLEEVGRQAFGHFLEPSPVPGGHAVPRLWGPKVQQVHAIQVQVLRVPPEEGPPHAEVEVRGHHACSPRAPLLPQGPRQQRVQPGHAPALAVRV